MNQEAFQKIWKMVGLRYKSHPWHGIEIGENAPETVTAFIEIIPSDTVKYEIDKKTGYLKVDRPQKFSNIVPALYGFIPQTYCKQRVAEYCMTRTGRSDIIVQAIPIGGFRMIDNGEADDKIIAVLKHDDVYGQWDDVMQLPPSIVNRLKHYFLTYKQLPGSAQQCEITHVYGREEAMAVIQASRRDYQEYYGDLENVMSLTLVEMMNFGQRQQEILKSL
jgi:inorganic pyrophosphatase